MYTRLRGKMPVKVDGIEQFEGPGHVAVTEVAPGIRVSTVFLGIDHNLGFIPFGHVTPYAVGQLQ